MNVKGISTHSDIDLQKIHKQARRSLPLAKPCVLFLILFYKPLYRIHRYADSRVGIVILV